MLEGPGMEHNPGKDLNSSQPLNSLSQEYALRVQDYQNVEYSAFLSYTHISMYEETCNYGFG